MSQPYVGEIRQFGGNFAPIGWMFCAGQTLPISEYEVLFQLIGTTYGGDGQSTFALPDLRGRVPIHLGTGGGATYVIGQSAGTETVTLTVSQIPPHTHQAIANSTSGSDSPVGNTWGNSNTAKPYVLPTGALTLNVASFANTGGNQPHDNMHPYAVISFIISLFGVFPSQN